MLNLTNYLFYKKTENEIYDEQLDRNIDDDVIYNVNYPKDKYTNICDAVFIELPPKSYIEQIIDYIYYKISFKY